MLTARKNGPVIVRLENPTDYEEIRALVTVTMRPSVLLQKFAGILRLRTSMRASGGPARRHASQMRSSWCHPFLRHGARTSSLRLPATICSTNIRSRTLEGGELRRVRMTDVAAESGLSRATVSLVLRDSPQIPDQMSTPRDRHPQNRGEGQS